MGKVDEGVALLDPVSEDIKIICEKVSSFTFEIPSPQEGPGPKKLWKYSTWLHPISRNPVPLIDILDYLNSNLDEADFLRSEPLNLNPHTLNKEAFLSVQSLVTGERFINVLTHQEVAAFRGDFNAIEYDLKFCKKFIPIVLFTILGRKYDLLGGEGSRGRHSALLRALIKAKVQISHEEWETSALEENRKPFYSFFLDHELLRAIVRSDYRLVYEGGPFFEKIFIASVYTFRYKCVHTLLEGMSLPRKADHAGNNILHLAIEKIYEKDVQEEQILTLLHLLKSRKFEEILNSKNAEDESPIDIAFRINSIPLVLFLLKYGAICTQKDLEKWREMNRNSFYDFLGTFIEVKESGKFGKWERISVHFRVDDEFKNQTTFFTSLMKVKAKEIPTHPVVVAFLKYKWEKIQLFYYLYFAIYAVFLGVYTHFIYENFIDASNGFHVKTNRTKDEFRVSEMTLTHTNSLTASIVFLLTFVFYSLGFMKHTKIEYTFMALLCLSVTLTILSFDTTLMFFEDFSGLSILLGWSFVMIILGKHSVYGINVEIFQKVAVQFLYYIFMFTWLLVAFALGFFVLFRGEAPYYTFINSLVQMVTLMADGIDPLEMLLNRNDHRLILFQLSYMIAVLLMTIILMNFLVGITIYDIRKYKDQAQLLSKRLQADIILKIDGFLQFFWEKCPRVARLLVEVNLHKTELYLKGEKKRKNLAKWLFYKIFFLSGQIQLTRQNTQWLTSIKLAKSRRAQATFNEICLIECDLPSCQRPQPKSESLEDVHIGK